VIHLIFFNSTVAKWNFWRTISGGLLQTECRSHYSQCHSSEWNSKNWSNHGQSPGDLIISWSINQLLKNGTLCSLVWQQYLIRSEQNIIKYQMLQDNLPKYNLHCNRRASTSEHETWSDIRATVRRVMHNDVQHVRQDTGNDGLSTFNDRLISCEMTDSLISHRQQELNDGTLERCVEQLTMATAAAAAGLCLDDRCWVKDQWCYFTGLTTTCLRFYYRWKNTHVSKTCSSRARWRHKCIRISSKH